MTSPDLIHELKVSRPTAPTDLRMRVREISTQETSRSRSPWPSFRLPVRRMALVAMPAAIALAIVSAGVLGLVRSDGSTEVLRERTLEGVVAPSQTDNAVPEAAPGYGTWVTTAKDSAIGPTSDRAQRVSATITVEVPDAQAVSGAAQEAQDLTRSLGGHIVSASVATGEEGSAALTVRIPVNKVQEAIVKLSALGRIVSQQVSIQDLQEGLDAMERREKSVREQIARITARLDSEGLDAGTRAALESRKKSLQTELRELRRGIGSTKAEARMATIDLTVVTPDGLGVAPTPTRLDRTLDEALNVLVWEGVIVLATLIVVAPFALVFFAAWLGRRFQRRREEDRLLAAS